MSESLKKSQKLFKVAKEFNVGTQSVVELLARKGYKVANDPNEKLTPEMVELIVKEYEPDRKMKEKAEQVKDFHKGMKQNLLTPIELTPLDALEPLQDITAFQLRTDIAEADSKRKTQDSPERKPETPALLEPILAEPPVVPLPVVQPLAPETPPTPLPTAEAKPTAQETPGHEPEKQPKPEAENQPRTQEVAPVAEHTPPADATSGAEAPSTTSPTAEEPKLGGLRVVGKVDLDALRKPQHPKGKDQGHKGAPQAKDKGPKTQQPEVPQLGLFGTPEPPATPTPTEPERKPTPAEQPVAETTPAILPTPEAKEPKATPPDAQPVTTDVAPPALSPTDTPPKADAPATPTPDTPTIPAEDEVLRAKAPELAGLKVMGKIDLGQHNRGRGPANDDKNNTAESEADKRKRKRKRKRAGTSVPINPALGTDKPAGPNAPIGASSVGRGGNTPGTGNTYSSGGNTTGGGGGTGGGGKPGKGGKGGKQRREEVSREEVNSNLRSTLAQMGKGTGRKRQKLRRATRDERSRQRDYEAQERLAQESILHVTEFLTASELANLMKVSVNEVIAKCMELGQMVSINQRMQRDIIELIAEEFDYEVEFMTAEESFREEEEAEDESANLQPRHPIVTVMGHVDHGKTSLLDYVRKANVISGEAGGITQHIGAYEVTLPDSGRKITFLDTPGHEAFTAMRARGAQVTDVAIIVIAADDQVMPQTKEAINHAQAAGVPMVFAINKVDKPGANPEKIKEQLAAMNLLVEDWGGKYQCQHISAKFGQGVEELLEKVLLEADILELKADPDRQARGTVIESLLDKGRGVVTTVLVQSGTLRVGDVILANCYYGRVKNMMDERGKQVKEAGPSTPVQILGLNGVPQAGDKFQVYESDKEARVVASKREQLLREQRQRTMNTRLTLEQVAAQSKLGDIQELNLIVKGDVDGSVEALSDSLIKLSTDRLKVNIVMKAVGQISESDVLLASASNAIIVGFNVRPSVNARKLVQQERVDVRFYNIIYNAINEIQDALQGLLAPEMKEEVLGVAEVRDVFKVSKVGTVAGCKVVDGVIKRSEPIRITRDGIVVFTGKIEGLRRHKDDVREVLEGFECGISIENFNDVKIGDLIESYTSVEVKRTA